MKKTLVRAALILSMLIVMTASASSWIQTNWPASNSYFSLYSSQDKVFARIWDTLNGGRVFLTADNGANWTQISSAEPDIDILSIVLLNPNILAGTWDGFYLSTDGGTSFNAFIPTGVPADTVISSLAMIDTTLFAGTTGHIYKSIDNGNTWTEVSSGIAADARITSFVASGGAVFAGSASNGVFKTTNGGASWAAVNSGITDTHISQLAVLGTRLFAVTLTDVFISDNGGTSWVPDSSGLEDVNCLAVVNNQLYAGTDDDGVYLSVDSGATWTAVPTGMPTNTRIWSLAATSGYLFAGTDSGVWRVPISTVTYTITASASAGGTISPTGDVTVYEHASQTFTITPNVGFAVSDVLVDGASVGAVGSYTFTNATADHTISASFHAVPTYTITASAGAGGTIWPSGSVLVSEGSSQTFTITPQTGYSIASLTVDGSAVEIVSSYTFTNVTSDHTISATFSINTYTITATAGAGGTISPSGTVSVQYGSSQTFTISPSSGYQITNVLVDGVSVGAVSSYTFSSVAANHTISATFNLLATYRINCGGSAASPYTADQYYSGGTARTVTNNIDTSGVTNPAPQAVYRSERYGTVTYTFPNLSVGASYTVRLHFAELYWTATGKRIFNVLINGTTVLSNYDIYAATGARYKAIVREFTTTANTSGQIVINFNTITDNATIEGIEIIPVAPNAAPTIATPAAAAPNPVIGTTTALSVLGADDAGEANLTYAWATTGTPPASVTFSANGTNAAKNTTATFSKAGDYTFQVTVTDAGGLTATSSVNVTVDQTLTSIVLSPASATVTTSATQQFTATALDQFATSLTTQPTFTWSVSGGGTIDASGLFMAGTIPGGPYTVTATSGSVSGTASVTVTKINHPPVAYPQSVTTDEDTAVVITLTGSDEDLDPLTFAVTSGPQHGTLSGTGANRTYTPAANYNDADSFAFVVNDGQVNSSAATVNITVTAVNDAPVANAQSVTTQQDTALAITLTGSDVDGDTLTYSVVTAPSHGTLSGTAPNLTYTPTSGYSGSDSFTFKVNDGALDSAAATVSITVTTPGDTVYLSLAEDSTLTGLGTVNDEDIVALNLGTGVYSWVFDGSDVGITTDIDAIDVLPNGHILMSFDANTTVTGIGTVADADVVEFTPTSLGANTAGTFTWKFDGSDVGLSSNTEDIDTLYMMNDGTMLISTVDAFSVTGISGQDEDIIRFTATSWGSTTAGSWSWYFDGSDVGLSTNANEDVDALWVDQTTTPYPYLYLSTLGGFSVTGVSGANEDVFVFMPTALGSTTTGTFMSTLYMDGSLFGLSSYNVDAFDVQR